MITLLAMARWSPDASVLLDILQEVSEDNNGDEAS